MDSLSLLQCHIWSYDISELFSMLDNDAVMWFVAEGRVSFNFMSLQWPVRVTQQFLSHNNSIFIFEIHYFCEKSNLHFGKTSSSTKICYFHLGQTAFSTHNAICNFENCNFHMGNCYFQTTRQFANLLCSGTSIFIPAKQSFYTSKTQFNFLSENVLSLFLFSFKMRSFLHFNN